MFRGDSTTTIIQRSFAEHLRYQAWSPEPQFGHRGAGAPPPSRRRRRQPRVECSPLQSPHRSSGWRQLRWGCSKAWHRKQLIVFGAAPEVQRRWEVPQERQPVASCGEAASTASVEQAPLCRSRVLGDRVQSKVDGVFKQGTLHLWLLPDDHDATGFLGSKCLQGTDELPGPSTDDEVPGRRHRHPEPGARGGDVAPPPSS